MQSQYKYISSHIITFGTQLRCRFSFTSVQKVTLLAVNDLDWIWMGGSVMRPFCSVSNIS